MDIVRDMDCAEAAFRLSCEIAKVSSAIGSTNADWWMVWVTGASAVASVFVAFAAVSNAKKANTIADEAVTIAKEASARDERYRLEEQELAAYNKRVKVALAMHAALNQLLVWMETNPLTKSATTDEAVSEFRKLRVIAQSLIDLETYRTDDLLLRRWFTSGLGEVEDLSTSRHADKQEIYHHAARFRADINKWSQGTPVRSLTSVKMPPSDNLV